MNKEFHTYINKAGDDISLSQEQRERMRETIVAYMEMKPIRTPARSASYASTVSWSWNARPIAAFLVLALFVSSAGISYAAENSLPGDLLYSIKTNVNEPVQGALATTPSAKATWAISVADERIQEAATLAAEGQLGTTTQQELQDNFDAHAQIAEQAIAEQASSSPEDGAEAAVSFQAQLAEYKDVIAQVGMASNVDTMPLASAIQAQSDQIAAIASSTESVVASSSDAVYAAGSMQVAAKEQLDVSAQLAQQEAGSLSSTSAQIVSAQLNNASTTISAGEADAASNATSSALGEFKKALAATAELDVFLQTSSAIHAHTGLVVGQPQRGDHKWGRSATTTSATTTSSGDVTTPDLTATSTSMIEEGSEFATDTSVDISAEAQGSSNTPAAPSAPQLQSVPVSVPTSL